MSHVERRGGRGVWLKFWVLIEYETDYSLMINNWLARDLIDARGVTEGCAQLFIVM